MGERDRRRECDVGGRKRGVESKVRERNETEQGCSSVQRAGIAAGAPFCCSCISIQDYMHHPPHPSDHDGGGDDGDGDDDDDDADAAGKQKNIGRVEYPSLFVVAAYISSSCSSNSNRSTRRGLILSVCTS